MEFSGKCLLHYPTEEAGVAFLTAGTEVNQQKSIKSSVLI